MNRLKLVLALALLALGAPTALGQNFVCGVDSKGEDHCNYSGKVRKVLMNQDNLVLVFFERDVDIDILSANGTFTNVRTGAAVAFNAEKNPVFANALLDAAIRASLEGARMSFEIDGGYGRYLKMNFFAVIGND